MFRIIPLFGFAALLIFSVSNAAVGAQTIAGNATPGTTNYPNGGMTRLGSVNNMPDPIPYQSAVIDPAAGYAYFAGGVPGRIRKIGLDRDGRAASWVSTLPLKASEELLYVSAIDLTNKYLYLGTNNPNLSIFLKADTELGDTAPRRVGNVILDANDIRMRCIGIDTTGGYAYIGRNGPTARIVKVALGTGDELPGEVAALDVNSAGFPSCFIDPSGQYGFFTSTSPSGVAKIALGLDDAPPGLIGLAEFAADEQLAFSSVADFEKGYAWFGTNRSPGRIVKTTLGANNSLPARIGALTLDEGENFLRTVVIAAESNFAYFVAFTNPGRVIKVSLGEGNDLPLKVATLILEAAESLHESAIIDPQTDYLYLASTQSQPLVKLATSQKGFLKASRIQMQEPGILRSASFYAHEARGNVRLAIYDDIAPRNLIWQSTSIPIKSAGWNTVPVFSCNTGEVMLAAGNYWFAWQIDIGANVASYVPASSGDGLYIPRPFGFAPEALDPFAPIYTNETWATYVDYDPVDGPQSGLRQAVKFAELSEPSIQGESARSAPNKETVIPTDTPLAFTDACAEAVSVTLGEYYMQYTDLDPKDTDGSAPCVHLSGADVWCRFTPDFTGGVTVSSCGSSYDTVLSVHSSCSGGAILACNDDFCGQQAQVSLDVAAGTTYLIRLAGYQGPTVEAATGPYIFRITSGFQITATPSPTPTERPTPTPSMCRLNGDFDQTGCTDLNDFLLLLDMWQQPYEKILMDIPEFLNLLDGWQTGSQC